MSTATVSAACVCASRRLAHTSRELAGFQHCSTLDRPETPTTATTTPLGTLAAELHSLQDVLVQTTDAISTCTFPQDLAIYLPTIISACSPIVDDLRDVLSAEPSTAAASVAQNCAGHVEPVLQVCRLALGLALDLVAALHASSAADATSDLACVLAGAAHLRTRVRAEWHDGGMNTANSGQRAILAYLKILCEQAHTALGHGDSRPVSPTTPMQRIQHTPSVSSVCEQDSPVDCSPDSAIDLDDTFADDLLAFPLPPRSPVREASKTALPVLVAPTTARSPPPLLPARSVRRSIAACSEFSTATTDTAVNTSLFPSRPPTPPPKAPSRAGTAMARRSVARASLESSVAETLLATETVATSVSGSEAATATASEGKASSAAPVPPAPLPASPPSQTTTRLSILGLFRSRAHAGHHARMTSAAAVASGVSALAANGGASRRFSISLPTRLLADSSASPRTHSNGNASKEPEGAVFGVPLRKSLAVASTAARTHHGGPTSTSSAKKSSSVRAFPLCVFACYTFLGAAGMDRIGTPGLFDAAYTDQAHVARLRTIFSTAPSYGADLFKEGAPGFASNSEFTPHDAAALILEFLAALPHPIVSETVARRWVALSRQAAAEAEIDGHGAGRWTTTSHATRVDQCLDFWDEALGGGGLGRDSAIARSLLKLLLNLWGDVADAADRNGMPAERLAGKVLEPLMHLDHGSSAGGGGRHAGMSSSSSSSASAYTRTDYMLGLAFIIRKRSEYGQLLRGSGRKSRAAFAG